MLGAGNQKALDNPKRSKLVTVVLQGITRYSDTMYGFLERRVFKNVINHIRNHIPII